MVQLPVIEVKSMVTMPLMLIGQLARIVVTIEQLLLVSQVQRQLSVVPSLATLHLEPQCCSTFR